MQRWATSNAFHIHFFWQKGESMIWCIETLACWEENSVVHFNCRANLACRGKKGNIAGRLVEIVVDYHLATPRLDTVTCIALIKYEMTTCTWCAANAAILVGKLHSPANCNLVCNSSWLNWISARSTFGSGLSFRAILCNISAYSYIHLSNIRIQQRLLANYIPGDTHNLQR